MPTHRKTRRSYDTPGEAHFLTFSCYRRAPLLARDRSREWFLQALRVCQAKGRFDLWAYVVMPEHVHLVVLPSAGVKISQILTTLKQSTSKRALRWLREHAPEVLTAMEDRRPDGTVRHRFWQRGGGYDRNLRSARDVHEKIGYTHENPVRRGLVRRAVDWPWSSAAAWETGVDGPVTIDRQSVPMPTAVGGSKRSTGD